MITPLVLWFSVRKTLIIEFLQYEYDDVSKYDPLNQTETVKDFNLFFESYFAKGMPCIFTNGGLNDPASVR